MMTPAQPPEERDAAIGREFEDRLYKGHAFKAHEKDSSPGLNPVLEQERERLALKGILKNSVRCVSIIIMLTKEENTPCAQSVQG